MNHKNRYKRVRLLTKKLNKARKKQAKKLDILCNGLVAANREFINSLNRLAFTANFYESLLGTTDLNNLFSTAERLIKQETGDANVAFFLPQENDFEMHVFRSNQPEVIAKPLEEFFTPELVDALCKSNRICKGDSLFAMGLQANPAILNQISAVTVPLSRLGVVSGFILIYRSSENALTEAEVNKARSISEGLSRAIQSCKVLS